MIINNFYFCPQKRMLFTEELSRVMEVIQQQEETNKTVWTFTYYYYQAICSFPINKFTYFHWNLWPFHLFLTINLILN